MNGCHLFKIEIEKKFSIAVLSPNGADLGYFYVGYFCLKNLTERLPPFLEKKV